MSASFSRNLEVAQGLEATIRNGISRLSSTPGSDYEETVNRINSQINDLQQKVGGLRGLMKALGSDERELYAEDIEELDRSCTQLRSQLQTARQRIGAQQQVQNIHDSNMQKGDNILNSFDNSLAIGNDTLQTQQKTLNTLAEDQKHLDNIEENLSVVDSEAVTGEKTATRMYRRQLIIRIVSWSICGALFILFIFSLVWNLKPK